MKAVPRACPRYCAGTGMGSRFSIGKITFENKEAYRAGLRDLERIRSFAADVNLESRGEAAELYQVLKTQPFLFETELGIAFRSYLLDRSEGLKRSSGLFSEELLTEGKKKRRRRSAPPSGEDIPEEDGDYAKDREEGTAGGRPGRKQREIRPSGRRKSRSSQPAEMLWNGRSDGSAETLRRSRPGEREENRTERRGRGRPSRDYAEDRTDQPGAGRSAGRRERRSEIFRKAGPESRPHRTVKKKAVHADKKKRSKRLLTALGITACLGLMLFSLYRIFSYDIWSYISRRKMEKLASSVLIPVEAQVSEEHRIADLIASGLYTEEEAAVKAGQEAAEAENITGAGSDILYKYSVLYGRNSDMAGWIQIPGTVVNYPVMLTPGDEEFYLKKGFDKKYDINGIPFMDTRCSVSEPTTNYLIYGHNMKNGSMFSALLNYEQEDFYREHPRIRFDTVYETGQYEIVGVFRTQIAFQGDESYRYYQFIQAESSEEYDAYIAYVKEQSFYDTGVTAEFGTQLLTLSTCDRSIEEGRLVVVGRKCESTEKER